MLCVPSNPRSAFALVSILRFVLCTVVLAAYAAVAPAHAQPFLSGADARERLVSPLGDPQLPNGFYLESAASGARFNLPVGMGFASDGRLFVAEKAGRVYVVENEAKQAEPLLDLSGEVLNQHDRGLLGIALDPDFDTNGYVYLSYVVDHERTDDTDRLDAFARVTRYTVLPGTPYRADPSSRRVLIGETFGTGIPACFFGHTIGTLAFGSDGTLFVGAGDAASYESLDDGGLYADCFGPDRLDPAEDIGAFRAQDVNSLAGKILRIDPETGLGLPSNPFWTGDGADDASRVWALGLRNPFRFSVDTEAGSTDPGAGNPGTLYVADVGWYYWEELNIARGGENFGWPCYEGPELHDWYAPSFPNGPPGAPELLTCALIDAVRPASYWSHRDTTASFPSGLEGGSITGGDLYKGTAYPAAYTGRLFYSDFSQRWMGTAVPTGLSLAQHETFSLNAGPVVSMRYDASTEVMHWIDIYDGAIYRLRFLGSDMNAAPVAFATAGPVTGDDFRTLPLDASASYDPDSTALSFFWDFGDGTFGEEPLLTHTYAEAGAYEVTLLVTDAEGAFSRYVLPVVVGSAPPAILSVSPGDLATVTIGAGVVLEAKATDPEGEPLAYTWSIWQIHDVHEHPSIFEGEGRQLLFQVPDHGIPGEYVGYNVRLTVTDPVGVAASTSFVLHAEYPHTLPGGWHTRTIGGRAVGGARYEAGTFTLAGGGAAPDSTHDYVRFAYRLLGADGSLDARVEDVAGPAGTVAGLMMRTSLYADAAQVFAVWDEQGLGVRHRRLDGEPGGYEACQGVDSSDMLRLRRTGAQVELLTSRNGWEWATCASVALPGEDEPWYAGFAVASTTDGPGSARFSRLPASPDSDLEPTRELRILQTYPNPTMGLVSLRLSIPKAQPIRVDVFDTLGRRVRSAETPTPQFNEAVLPLRIGSLPPGQYIVRVVQGEARTVTTVSVL